MSFVHTDNYRSKIREVGRVRFNNFRNGCYTPLIHEKSSFISRLEESWTGVEIKDDVIDIKILRSAQFKSQVEEHIAFDFSQIAIEDLSYDHIPNRLVLKKLSPEIKFSEYYKLVFLLKTLCASLRKRSKSGYLIIRKSDLIDLYKYVFNVDEGIAREVVKLSVFQKSRRSLELWDASLIEDNGQLIISPPVILSSDPLRIIENFTSQYNDKLFGSRGKVFENAVLKIFQDNQIPIEQKRIDLGGESIEFDGVAYWDGNLVLLEAKCSKNAIEENDYRNLLKVVKDSQQQLERRKNAISANWIEFKQHFAFVSAENLPQIYTISVINSPSYYQPLIENSAVVDKRALERFFESPTFEEIVYTQEGSEQISQTRFRSDDPKFEDFLKYIKFLPQVKLIYTRLGVRFQEIMKWEEYIIRAEIITTEYSPIDLKAELP